MVLTAEVKTCSASVSIVSDHTAVASVLLGYITHEPGRRSLRVKTYVV